MELHRFFRYAIEKMCKEKKSLNHFNINVYVSGKNLLTFTKWKGWDPEAGQDYFGRPVLKSFTVGLNVTL